MPPWFNDETGAMIALDSTVSMRGTTTQLAINKREDNAPRNAAFDDKKRGDNTPRNADFDAVGAGAMTALKMNINSNGCGCTRTEQARTVVM